MSSNHFSWHVFLGYASRKLHGDRVCWGTIWAFLLSTIILMPIITPVMRKRIESLSKGAVVINIAVIQNSHKESVAPITEQELFLLKWGLELMAWNHNEGNPACYNADRLGQ